MGRAAHNDKAWFCAHRAEYDAHYVGPALAFTAAIVERLQAPSVHVVADPRVNGGLFRTNREVRHSQNTTPGKGHLDMWL